MLLKIESIRWLMILGWGGSFLLPVGCGDGPRMGDRADLHPPVEFRLMLDDDRGLSYIIRRGDTTVIDSSPLGIIMDETSREAVFSPVIVQESTPLEIRFPERGYKSRGTVSGRETIYRIGAGEDAWRIQVRTFPDGVAWRYLYQDRGIGWLRSERTAFTLPDLTCIWAMYQTHNYEGWIYKVCLGENGIPAPPEREDSNTLGIPLTFQLPDQSYGSILVSGAPNYPALTLLPVSGRNRLQAVFEKNTEGWKMERDIVSSWWVVLTGPTLNDLVRSDILPSLSAPPDPELFPDGLETDWCRPGICGWSWGAEGTEGMAWEKQYELVDQVSELRFPYYLVDVGWEEPGNNWLISPEMGAWKRLGELCRYAAQREVSIWIWRSWKKEPEKFHPGLETSIDREDFFRRAKQAGVAGIKVDFLSSGLGQDRRRILDCLKLAASYRLMISFHGVDKPAGESLTWPNEMTREGVRGVEHYKWGRPLSPRHYSQLLFTRYLAGPADLTPIALRAESRGRTTIAFQLATGVLMTSPILCLAETPKTYLDFSGRSLLENLPTVWDDTRAVPGSTIGGWAGLIRRAGLEWWIGIINPEEKQSISLPLTVLPPGRFKAEIWEDGEADQIKVDRLFFNRDDVLNLTLRVGGGAVVRLVPE